MSKRYGFGTVNGGIRRECGRYELLEDAAEAAKREPGRAYIEDSLIRKSFKRIEYLDGQLVKIVSR